MTDQFWSFSGSALKNKGVQPLLDAVVDFLPNPAERINMGLMEGKEEKSVTIALDPSRSAEKPFLGFAFKLDIGKVGQLSFVRVYQGCLSRGDWVWNTRTGKKCRVNRLVRMHSDEMEDVTEVFAGDICAMTGVDCASGDSFVSVPDYKVSMENIHIPEPVISMSIKAKDASKHSDNFSKAINRFTREDPTFRVFFDPEIKETICQGTHIYINFLRRNICLCGRNFFDLFILQVWESCTWKFMLSEWSVNITHQSYSVNQKFPSEKPFSHQPPLITFTNDKVVVLVNMVASLECWNPFLQTGTSR